MKTFKIMSRFVSIVFTGVTLTFMGTILGISGIGGCGGGGSTRGASGSTDVSSLEIADQMSLVTADESGLSSSLSALVKFAAPTGGDFLTDEPQIWVYDESMQALDLINEILCMVEQTAYTEMVNQGNYTALIESSLCEDRRGDHSSDGSNQSSGQEKEFETWTVNSSRADDSSPQIVTFWVPGEASSEDPFDEIRAELTITEGKSDSNPYGVFSMNFVGYMNGSPGMSGNLASSNTDEGLVDFQMVIDGGDFFQEQTHALIVPDGSSGQAYVSHNASFEGFPFSETVHVAFDADHYLANFEGEDTVCLDRTDFHENVWEYNLYDATGARLERNSGMTIRVPGSPGSEDEHNFGWADYYGIWAPPELGILSAGDEVTNEDGSVTYTIFQGGGRLIRRTRQELTLGDFVNDVFNMWNQETNQTVLVRWDGTNLVKFAIDECGPDGCSQTSIPEANVTLVANDFIGLWKQGLGNLDIVVPASGKLSNDLVVPLYKEEFVTPSDSVFASGDLQLKCYSMCPKAPLTATMFNSGELFEDDIMDNKTTPYTYTISAEDMTLKRNGTSVTIERGTEVDPSSPNFWGMRSGAMVTTDTSLPNFWEIWSQETQYMYEAGPNEWNFPSFLIDSDGQAVSFEAPLKCLYQSDENGTYYLDYHGEGRLFGIPFEKVASDDEKGFEIWAAKFTIPNGTELDCDGTLYYTKAMMIEQSMEEVDASACSDLSVDGLDAPTNEFTDPELDAAPTVTDPPAVISGVVQ